VGILKIHPFEEKNLMGGEVIRLSFEKHGNSTKRGPKGVSGRRKEDPNHATIVRSGGESKGPREQKKGIRS